MRVIVLDFSKAFDRIRHSVLINKYSQLNLPACVQDWLVKFFTGRQHCTKFNNDISSLRTISASVIQGSALGPVSYAVTASDLRPVHLHNDILKFADDTYLIVPSNYIDTTEDELTNIENWSTANNLQLNKSKSHEILFVPPRLKIKDVLIPPLFMKLKGSPN